jgi:hypothetical protein
MSTEPVIDKKTQKKRNDCYEKAMGNFLSDKPTSNEFILSKDEYENIQEFNNSIGKFTKEIGNEKINSSETLNTFLENYPKNNKTFETKTFTMKFNEFFLNLILEDYLNYCKNLNNEITMQPSDKIDDLRNFILKNLRADPPNSKLIDVARDIKPITPDNFFYNSINLHNIVSKENNAKSLAAANANANESFGGKRKKTHRIKKRYLRSWRK